MKTIKEIEMMEYKYLDIINSVLKINKPNIIKSLNTINKHKKFWKDIVKDNSISDTGAERIIYSVINTNIGSLGEIHSNPIGSDLMFENNEAVIHIDCKVANKRTNENDHIKNVPIGENQFSYKTVDTIKTGENREVKPNLPTSYNNKICLTYIISILYDLDERTKRFNLLSIFTCCCPNGKLERYYKLNLKDKNGNFVRVLNADKPGDNWIIKIKYKNKTHKFSEDMKMSEKKLATKFGINTKELFKNSVITRKKNGARFNHKNCDKFLLLDNKPDRLIKLV